MNGFLDLEILMVLHLSGREAIPHFFTIQLVGSSHPIGGRSLLYRKQSVFLIGHSQAGR